MADLRVMVVDDEPLVRRGMAKFLSTQSGLESLPEARNGREAVELIEKHRPDLIFLDVQMPEMDGFDVLASLDAETLPAVVFVTAYDEYAIKAFDVHAVDYLLKPFDDQRLGVALERARVRLREADNGMDATFTALLDELHGRRRRVERFMVRTGGRIYFVEADEVDWFEAADNYVRLHVGDRNHLIRETIGSLEGRLDPERFLRIHRSTIINASRLEEMRPLPSGDCDVVLRGGTTARLSRSYRAEFEKRMMSG